MARILILVSAALLLAGCTDADWSHIMPTGGSSAANEFPPDEAPGPTTISTHPKPQNPSTEEKCRRVARERSDDALTQGFDETVQQQVHDATYSDCITWAVRTESH